MLDLAEVTSVNHAIQASEPLRDQQLIAPGCFAFERGIFGGRSKRTEI